MRKSDLAMLSFDKGEGVKNGLVIDASDDEIYTTAMYCQK
jgi:hypothetical protein